MNAAEALRSRVLNNAVKDLLGGEFMYPEVVPNSADAPDSYIVYQEIAAPPDNHLEGTSGLTHYLFQVSCIAADADSARALRKEVFAAAISNNDAEFSAVVQDQRMQYVEAVRRHDAQIDISVWSRDT